MELELTTLCDRFPVPDPRLCLEHAHDWLASREAVGSVLLPVDADDTHDPCVAGDDPRGMRRSSRDGLREFESRGGKERV